MLLAVDIQPHRSPTRRHMHNYSLPSPSALVPTARSPTRCQSSPTLTDFREAIYIPETRLTHSRTAVAVASTSRTPSLRTAVSNPSLLGWRSDESRLATGSPRLSPKQTRSASAMASPYYSKYYTPSPTPPARAITKKLKSRTPILKRLSTLSLRALPIPLPTPPEEGSETEWTIDPFAAPSTTTRAMPLEPVPQSKWSPASSTSSLVVEETTPTKKLKNLLGRLSIHKTQPSVLKDSSASRRSSVTTFVAVDSEPSFESAEGITTISKPTARQTIEMRRPSNEDIRVSPRKNREHRSVLEKPRPRHHVERMANESANARGQVVANNEKTSLGRSVKERSHPQTVYKTQFPSSAGHTAQSNSASACFATSRIQTGTAPSRCTHSPLPGCPPNATPCAPSISGQPPAIPPRSKLRPPPVKILPLSRSHTRESFSNPPGPRAQCFEAPLEEALIKSGFTSCSPPISPLPTPPMLSPTTTSPIHSPATIKFPVTSEPRLGLPICKEVDAKMNAKSAETIAREEAYLRRLITCGRGSIPEFFSQEEPRPPPSRLSCHTNRERNDDDSETDDEAVEFYAMYSTHFRPRTPSFTRRRVPSLRRKNSRSERRSLATSMVSIYSQASAALSPEDLMDLPPVPALPWSLRRDPDHADTRPPTPPLAQPTVARTPPRASPLSSPPASPELFTDEWRGLLSSRTIRQKQPSRLSTNASVTSVVDISVSGCLPAHESDTVVPARRRDTFLPWRQQTVIRPMRTANERQTKSMLSRMTGLKNRFQVFSLSFRSSTSHVAASSMRSSKAAPWLSPADAARLQSNVIHITRSSFALHSS
ncbi:hypothetical protein HMN09_00636800 [Mycena chlorophos]|uniref:Uncharacterized protein n=1 Tax=Mycena chlorophos TaxID=658473 RepID=A0A8H6T4Z3_MYCCL|nr:hypothetical protein HMN09_00636800 [Mycena chlorophos]